MTDDAAKKLEITLADKSHLLPDIACPYPPGEDDGYVRALWACGLKVVSSFRTKDYQGTWWALVEFPNGERYFVRDEFGSCSVCDPYLSEFERWTSPETGEYEDFQERPDYLHRLAAFGRQYVANCMTESQALEEASKNIDWDMDAQESVDWIKSVARSGPSAPERTALTAEE